jgi:aldose 1-epimerase
VRLQTGALVREIEPQLGGCIAGLWLDGKPVLRSTPALELLSVREAGSDSVVVLTNPALESAK